MREQLGHRLREETGLQSGSWWLGPWPPSCRPRDHRSFDTRKWLVEGGEAGRGWVVGRNLGFVHPAETPLTEVEGKLGGVQMLSQAALPPPRVRTKVGKWHQGLFHCPGTEPAVPAAARPEPGGHLQENLLRDRLGAALPLRDPSTSGWTWFQPFKSKVCLI